MNESTVLAAFPSDLINEVRPIVQVLPDARLPLGEPFVVWTQGEYLTIPDRLYNPELAKEALSRLTPTQTKVLHCLYTRHHDGHVRQHHLNQIIGATDPWIIPFVVKLIGEYVVDIVIAIKQGLTDIDQPGTPQHRAYGEFAAENPDFIFLTSQRVTSYWDCYYRNQFALRDYRGRDLRNHPVRNPIAYPGHTLIDSLKKAAKLRYRMTTIALPRQRAVRPFP